MASGYPGAVLRQIERAFRLGTFSAMSEEQLLAHFLDRRDEAAFEALVLRHGPMVWSVCHRVLAETHDAEDAFQATFVVLLRRADTLRDPGSLGPWLYGVASRVAARSRAGAALRRDKEQGAAKSEADHEISSTDKAHLRDALDEEIARLPQKYREPIVLCLLEGRTIAEAANWLRTTEGVIRGRLARGREQLRRKLVKRGVVPTVLTSPFAAPETGLPAVPPPLVLGTVELLAFLTMGRAPSMSLTTASVMALAEGVAQTMRLMKLKTAAAAILGLGLVSAVAWGLAQDEKPAPAQAVTRNAKGKAAATEDEKKDPARRTLEIVTVDHATGRPLPDVTLRIGIDQMRRDAATDVVGRYVVHDLPVDPERRFVLWATKKGFVPKVVWWRNPESGRLPESYTLEMEAATTIGGVVCDQGGKPIAGATVFIRADGGRDGVATNDIFEYPAKTDVEGRWKCDIAPRDLSMVSVRLVHSDFVSDQRYDPTRLPAHEELRARTAVMVMKRGAAIFGTVRDSEGKPIAAADVKLGTDRFGSPQSPSTKTDSEGHYQFHVEPGSHVLTVEVEGHAPDVKNVPAAQKREQVDFRLPPARTLRGRVVDSKGNPVPGVRIVPDTWRGYRTLATRLTSDVDGRFQWKGAPSDAVLFDILKSSFMPIRRRALTASDQEITITLSPPLHVHGSVVNAETGRPVESFTVIPGIVITDDRPHWVYRQAQTARHGRYEITFDDPRSPHLRIEAIGYRPSVSRGFREDEGDQQLDIKLQKANAIKGIVQSPDGVPLTGAQVILVTPGQEPTINNGRMMQPDRNPRVETDREGRFEFPAQDGNYSIAVFHDRGFAEWAPRSTDHDPILKLQPWGRIEGTYRQRAETAGRQVVVARRVGPDRFRSGAPYYVHRNATDDEGHFLLDRVPPGEFYVAPQFQHADGTTSTAGNGSSVEVQPGQTLRMILGETGRPLTGRFVVPKASKATVDWSKGQQRIQLELPRPAPPGGLTPEAQQRWWLDSAEAKAFRRVNRIYPFNVAPDGSFHVEGLGAGTYTISTQAYEPASKNERAPLRIVGSVSHRFVVPEMPGGRSDQALDLGEIELTLTKP